MNARADLPNVYRLMDDRMLRAAVADLERQASQLDYLREPAPAAVRAGIEDALLRARIEIERRGAI